MENNNKMYWEEVVPHEINSKKEIKSTLLDMFSDNGKIDQFIDESIKYL